MRGQAPGSILFFPVSVCFQCLSTAIYHFISSIFHRALIIDQYQHAVSWEHSISFTVFEFCVCACVRLLLENRLGAAIISIEFIYLYIIMMLIDIEIELFALLLHTLTASQPHYHSPSITYPLNVFI